MCIQTAIVQWVYTVTLTFVCNTHCPVQYICGGGLDTDESEECHCVQNRFFYLYIVCTYMGIYILCMSVCEIELCDWVYTPQLVMWGVHVCVWGGSGSYWYSHVYCNWERSRGLGCMCVNRTSAACKSAGPSVCLMPGTSPTCNNWTWTCTNW